MKFNKYLILQSIENSKQCLISKQQNISLDGQTYLTWPLFFSENTTQNSDVDVCTSGLGILAFSKFDFSNNDSLKIPITNSINTLISIRNADGSWPSNISLVSKDEIYMEGVISDTYYALSALLSVGFLSNSPKIDSFKNLKSNTELDTLDKRIDFINESVEWLLDNRVDHNQGWQYTGISYLERKQDKESLPAYTLPTANAIIILSEIVNLVNQLCPTHKMISKINSALNNSVHWFCDIQLNDKKNSGFGIKRGERSRVGNTSKVIVALCNAISDDNRDIIEKALQKSVKWLLKNYTPSKLLFSDVGEDFHQLIIEKEAGVFKNAYRRSINHETFAEPAVIHALQLYYNISKPKQLTFLKKIRIFSTLSTALSYLLNLQKHTGLQDGAIKSRRTANNEQYTMYTTSDFICSLIDVCKDEELFTKILHSKLRNIIFISSTAVFIVGAILLTFVTNIDSYWLTVPIGIVLSVIANIITEKII